LESYTAAGGSASPGSTSSLPVDSTATRGLRQTVAVALPIAASIPISSALMTVPLCSTVCPRAMSEPAKAMFCPGLIAR
jgi:hypothetical protein